MTFDTLTDSEQQALTALHRALVEQFGELIQEVVLFGSKARGDDRAGSDIDVLVVVGSDDWRIHKEISYLAVDIGLRYELYNLAPRIWSTCHLEQMATIDAAQYRQIQQDGIVLAV